MVNHHLPTICDCDNSWHTKSSDTEHEFETEQFSMTGKVFNLKLWNFHS